MNFRSLITIFYVTLTFVACNTEVSESKDYILPEKDLIPEGTAFNSQAQILYIGSTYKRKIVQINENGLHEDFIPSQMDGLWSPVGMEVDEERGILWVNVSHANEVMPLMNPESKRDWMTKVVAIDIASKSIIKEVEFEGTKGFFNDLTVLPDGNVFITESVGNQIYKVNLETNEPELFLSPKDFSFLNGITYSEGLDVLFVSATEGILRIDRDTRAYQLLIDKEDFDAKGIDGLAIHENYLIGHQSTKVSKFYLNKGETEIIASEVFDSGSEFDSSTTGEVGNGFYYFIVNSQIRSGVDYGKMSIKPLDSLEKVIIRKLKL